MPLLVSHRRKTCESSRKKISFRFFLRGLAFLAQFNQSTSIYDNTSQNPQSQGGRGGGGGGGGGGNLSRRNRQDKEEEEEAQKDWREGKSKK